MPSTVKRRKEPQPQLEERLTQGPTIGFEEVRAKHNGFAGELAVGLQKPIVLRGFTVKGALDAAEKIQLLCLDSQGRNAIPRLYTVFERLAPENKTEFGDLGVKVFSSQRALEAFLERLGSAHRLEPAKRSRLKPKTEESVDGLAIAEFETAKQATARLKKYFEECDDVKRSYLDGTESV